MSITIAYDKLRRIQNKIQIEIKTQNNPLGSKRNPKKYPGPK